MVHKDLVCANIQLFISVHHKSSTSKSSHDIPIQTSRYKVEEYGNMKIRCFRRTSSTAGQQIMHIFENSTMDMRKKRTKYKISIANL